MGWRPFRPGDDAERAVRCTCPLPGCMVHGGQVLRTERGSQAGNPITSPIELAQRLQELCGAEGYRIEGSQVLALRYDESGSEVVIDRFELSRVNG